MYRSVFKPLFDFCVAFVALLLTSPLILGAMLALAIVNRGHIWFLQPRPGKDGKIFTVIKFKTMTDARDAQGVLLPDSDRLTAAGRFIRKTSLDELPQLINVVKGDMSLVGPRPLLVEYLPRYSAEQARRHDVRPGITGWAQVNGRNAISWKQKFTYDVWYVDNLSAALDIKILFLTIMKVLKADGITSDTSVTMEKFMGDE
ncbi:sugar transferase [Dawidia soli]|uniref:Sugar transferase n=1 Tax=Dawidia soli TaxID=2782352 RepID=A0AAP2DAJ4_9BACT|nr:sugar transferase [Dawidia soli]MBT1688319.1 sugar transferase [Dawidia soli]